jgi:tetratricopeptide (TPR) repeat protein
MNADLFYSVLKQPALLNNVSETELAQIVNDYPWFGAAQFLLAVKKRKDASAGATEQLQKAALHFNHPLWMNWQLGQFEKTAAQTSTESIHSNSEQQVTEEPIITATASVISIDETDAVIDAEVMVEAADQAEIEQEELPLTNIRIADELAQTANAIQQQTEARHLKGSDLSISFEPYHTVDYFASQGIKLKEEKSTTDPLDKQVKTFTQWLKSMKKIYVEEGKQLDPLKEKEVMEMATESNQKQEIITETMANVLLQQGKKDKAIELLGKLILLHPEKSGYFAAKIEELKQ